MRVRTARVTVTPLPGDQARLAAGNETQVVNAAELLPALNLGQVTEDELRRGIKLEAYRNGTVNQDGSISPTQIDTLAFRTILHSSSFGDGVATMLGRMYVNTTVTYENEGYTIPYAFNVSGPFQPLRMDQGYFLAQDLESPLEVARHSIKSLLWTHFRSTVCDAGPPEIRVSEAQQLYPVIINLIAGLDIFYFGAN